MENKKEKHDPVYRFDYILQTTLNVLTSRLKTSDKDGSSELVRLNKVLKTGLGDRIRQIVVVEPTPETWPLDTSSRPRSSQIVTVGFVVNAVNIKRIVDRGPSAEDKDEVATFRKFWGDKAELRRFKDGSITESLVWTAASPGDSSVFEQVVRYLLHRHFDVATIDELKFFGGEVDRLVRGGSEVALFSDLMAAYNQLENDIRGLSDLPLSIRAIRSADSQLRYASVSPPSRAGLVARSRPADVILQFEGTSRWPDDLVAIQRTKIAFLLKIGELLEASHTNITPRVGLENEHHDVLNQAYLDVTYDSDFTFRLRIHHDREQVLFERQLKDKSSSPTTKETAAIGLAVYKRCYVKGPVHTQAMARLCLRHPALSGAIRLTKRWFACHLLSNHIADEVVELLVAHVFFHPSPFQTPSSVQTAFFRTLLRISRWDWRAEPLIVDLSGSGELKTSNRQAIQTTFQAWRKLDPALNRVCLFVASNVDPDGTTFTDGLPAKVVAGRMTTLARAACTVISAKQLTLDPTELFSSPLPDFDFVLHLSHKATGTAKTGSNGTTFKNIDLAQMADTNMIGFDPARDFLSELEATYASAVVFFYGSSERPVIAGLWSPLTSKRAWKVNLAYSTMPARGATEDDAQAVINKKAMLAEMARLGGDLIEKVEVFNQ